MPQEKKAKVKAPVNKAQLMARPNVNMIVNSNASKMVKNYRLHLVGLTHVEIAALNNCTTGNVSRDLWGFKSGRLKIPYET